MTGLDIEAVAKTLPPGTVGLSTIEGFTGAFVRNGQVLMGARPKDAHWTHTFIVGEGDDVYEAMPGGARRSSLRAYLAEAAAGDEVTFLDVGADPVRAVAAAEALLGTPYSITTYVYLAVRRLGQYTRTLALLWATLAVLAAGADWNVAAALAGAGAVVSAVGVWLSSSAWLLRRLADNGHLICSQHVDEVCRRAGAHLFYGRARQDVMPADIARLARLEPDRARTLLRIEVVH